MTNEQQKLLKVLKSFDNICRAKNIKYSLHGGTLLGCIRNSSFIPWDDDVDISMRRKDFNKLLEICKKSNEFKIIQNIGWIPRFITRKEEAHIDILIWDFVSENTFIRNIKIFFLRFLQGMSKETLEINDERILFKFLICFAYIFGRLFTSSFKREIYDKFSENFLNGSKKYIARLNDNYDSVGIVNEKIVMDVYIDRLFEGTNFMCSKYFDTILVDSYGQNYLIPPPSSERKEVHKYFNEKIKYDE